MTEQQIIETLATKVMGWEVVILNVGGNTVAHYGKNPEWNPLQNIADAWQVVEKLLSGFLLFDLAADEDGWWARFKMVDKTFIDTKEWVFFGKTVQEAICKAALKVHEIDLTKR